MKCVACGPKGAKGELVEEEAMMDSPAAELEAMTTRGAGNGVDIVDDGV